MSCERRVIGGAKSARPEQMKSRTRRKSPTRRKTTRPTALTPSCLRNAPVCGQDNLQDRKRESRHHVIGCNAVRTFCAANPLGLIRPKGSAKRYPLAYVRWG